MDIIGKFDENLPNVEKDIYQRTVQENSQTFDCLNNLFNSFFNCDPLKERVKYL